MKNTRRTILTHAGLVALSCKVFPSTAQGLDEAAQKQAQQPIVKPFRTVDVPSDKAKVLIFFDFNCPFCAQHHASLMNWKNTAPASIKVIPVPVVNPADTGKFQSQAIAARCYYLAEQMVSGARLDAFTTAVYSMVAKGLTLSDPSTWLRSCQAADINVREFSRRAAAEDQALGIKYSLQKLADYRLRATPSIAIGGKFVLTPDDVFGDEAMFFNMLNGLTSRIISS